MSESGLHKHRASKGTKRGRPKIDPLHDGFNEHSGFWKPILASIGRDIVRRGAMTETQWTEFSGEWGEWVQLKAVAVNPGQMLSDDKNAGAAEMRSFVCKMIVKYPVAVPLYLARIREEVAGFSECERWLFYNWDRTRHTDGELCRRYEAETGKTVKPASMTQARENLYRRVKGSVRPT